MPQPPKKNRAPVKDSEELADELGKAISLHRLHESEGGKILIDGLVTDILGVVDILCYEMDEATHIRLVGLIAKMKERKDILQALTSSKANREAYKELLEEALKLEKENDPIPEEPK